MHRGFMHVTGMQLLVPLKAQHAMQPLSIVHMPSVGHGGSMKRPCLHTCTLCKYGGC